MIGGPAVVDTNVVVSGLLTRLAASPTAQILDGMLAGSFRFLLSLELIAEYREVLLRPKIRSHHRLSEAEIDVLLAEIAANGVVVELERPEKGRRKGSDEHVWALVAADASAVLVTGDQRLLDAPMGDVTAMSPRAFVEKWDKS